MLQWSNFYRSLMSIESCSPDTERAVCADIMFTMAHQIHIMKTIVSCIPMYIGAIGHPELLSDIVYII